MAKQLLRDVFSKDRSNSSATMPSPRPAGAPPKSDKEQQRHEKEFKAMLEGFAKRELVKAEEERKAEEYELGRRKERDEQMSSASQEWSTDVLPNWERKCVNQEGTLCPSRQVTKLWGLGLPPNVRGTVWALSLGNQARITPQVWEAAKARVTAPPVVADEAAGGEADEVAKLASMIVVDLPRTYPVLAFFHDGGPLQQPLRQVLMAYAVYAPSIGYVQGMSYIAAMLLLNMDEYTAFKSLANMMFRHPHCLHFLQMDTTRMGPFYQLFDLCLMDNLPALHQHLYSLDVSLDMILLDWFMTMFCKSTPLDIAARIWDLFMRDGCQFLYKAGIGLLKLEQHKLLAMDFDQCMIAITRTREMQWDTFVAMDCISTIEIKSSRVRALDKLLSA